jgi:EAL domain-containing protein (putative c-di-GMP-specific phosphodiesterase class I)
MSVNVSMHQFKAQEFPALVSQVLNETDLEPQWLELEITESIAMENASETISRLATLKKMGIWLAIDDFGKGHSSLSHLKHLPITTLKIDRGFVGDILRDQYDFAIVEAIQSLAKSLDLDVVAEGVETQEQKQLLCRLGCKLGQGFLFSRPLPADDILSLCRLEKPFKDLF